MFFHSTFSRQFISAVLNGSPRNLHKFGVGSQLIIYFRKKFPTPKNFATLDTLADFSEKRYI